MIKEEIDNYLEKIIRVDLNDGSFVCGELDKYGMVEFPIKDYMVYSDYTRLRGFYLKDILNISEATQKDLSLDEIGCLNESMEQIQKKIYDMMNAFADMKARRDKLSEEVSE